MQRFKKFINIALRQIKFYFQKTTSTKKKDKAEIPLPPTTTKSKNNTHNSEPSTNKFYQRIKELKQKDVRAWLLVCATIAMAVYTIRLFNIATTQTDIANTNAIAANKAADAAISASNTARSQFKYQIWRDSINNVTQAKSQKSRDSLNFISIGLNRENIKLTDKNSRIDLRPYLLEPIGDSTFAIAEVNKNLVVNIEIMNCGRTPALNFFHTLSFMVIDSMTQTLFNQYIQQAQRHRNSGAEIGSYLHNIRFGIFDIYSRQDSIDVNKGRKKLVYWGVVSYGDIFKDEHLTWYCFEFNLRRRGWALNEKYCGMN